MAVSLAWYTDASRSTRAAGGSSETNRRHSFQLM